MITSTEAQLLTKKKQFAYAEDAANFEQQLLFELKQRENEYGIRQQASFALNNYVCWLDGSVSNDTKLRLVEFYKQMGFDVTFRSDRGFINAKMVINWR